VLDFFASKIEKNKIYSEKEINQIIGDNHSFNDICLIRRELIEKSYLERSNDGREYKRLR